jgi:hypothetical protein
MSATITPIAAAAAAHVTAHSIPASATADPLVRSIAAVCHEVNKAYCEAIGDATQPTWDDAPEWQKASAIEGVKLHLGNPNLGADASHRSWMRHKLDDGWTYGPLKDPAKKEHPCLVPFADLPKEQQIKDWLFRGVVHAIAREQAR